MYLQYTPSSKRNLSSKILHKSPPIYFLTLTKRFNLMLLTLFVSLFFNAYLKSRKDRYFFFFRKMSIPRLATARHQALSGKAACADRCRSMETLKRIQFTFEHPGLHMPYAVLVRQLPGVHPISTYRPESREASSPDSILELEPLMKTSQGQVKFSIITETFLQMWVIFGHNRKFYLNHRNIASITGKPSELHRFLREVGREVD